MDKNERFKAIMLGMFIASVVDFIALESFMIYMLHKFELSFTDVISLIFNT